MTKEKEIEFVIDAIESSSPIPDKDVENTIYYLKQGLTAPFILRYRAKKIGDKIDARTLKQIQDGLNDFEYVYIFLFKQFLFIGHLLYFYNVLRIVI